MRSRTSQWFEVAFRYDKVQEDGAKKPVTEQYVVDALSFSEGEKKITEEMSLYVSGVCSVRSMKRANFHEVFFSDNSKDDKWYKVKLQFITLDEKTEKEKRSNVVYLIQAGSFDKAKQSISEIMGGTMIDYVVVTVTETKIMDVFEH